MPARLIQLDRLPASPWKNGGGSTRQLAIHPPGADLEGFDWRISCAQVARGGPFSAFPGVDRSLALLRGDGLRLALGDDVHELRPCADIVDFAGEAAAGAELPGGPVEDLNVMSRRGAWRHRLWHEHVGGERLLHNDADVLLLLCNGGRLRIDGHPSLQAGQALLLEDEHGALCMAGESACLHVAQLYRRP
ncbi:MAG TPA: HutD family protein [Pseudomonas sp.]|nr:HutD family protein [Pseudomonas sp.]